MDRDERLADEAMALWTALFGEPPIVQADAGQMIEALLASLPLPPYGPPLPPN
jgi:hypothetical protein